jgi:hypothetical protein
MACSLWTEIPATIQWIKAHRDSAKHMDQLLRVTVNANLILLTACYVDGFLVECLKRIAKGRSDRTFLQRLTADFYARAQKSSGFEDISRLFKIATGKSLAQLSNKPQLHEAVNILFKFRNGLAHGRSIEYDTFANYQASRYETEFSGSYEEVEKYLTRRHLIKNRFAHGGSGWDYFAAAVADHFIDLIPEYPRAILRGLPREAAIPMRHMLKLASKPRHWC